MPYYRVYVSDEVVVWAENEDDALTWGGYLEVGRDLEVIEECPEPDDVVYVDGEETTPKNHQEVMNGLV